jgi:uncharacterized protein YbjT (DUF2867 family)
MVDTILVTGATGNLGSEVVRTLVSKGYSVRAAARDVGRVASGKGIVAVQFDFDDPRTFDSALEGVSGVFLIAPPLDPAAADRVNPFIDRAKYAAIEHIVLNSAFGADRSEDAPLRAVELHAIASSLSWTILRPNFFMENFSTGFLASMIRDRSAIVLSAGEAKTSFISVKDVARVAVMAFVQELFAEQFDLTGPLALDHTQVAQKITRVVGREIVYEPVDEIAMLRGARESGLPEPAVQYLGMLYAAMRAGQAAAITNEVGNITGRKPITFDEFARQNADAWKEQRVSV